MLISMASPVTAELEGIQVTHEALVPVGIDASIFTEDCIKFTTCLEEATLVEFDDFSILTNDPDSVVDANNQTSSCLIIHAVNIFSVLSAPGHYNSTMQLIHGVKSDMITMTCVTLDIVWALLEEDTVKDGRKVVQAAQPGQIYYQPY